MKGYSSLPLRVTIYYCILWTRRLDAFVAPHSKTAYQSSLHHAAVRSSTTQVTTIAGNIWPTIQKFKIGPEKANRIVTCILAVTDWRDLVLLCFFGFAAGPLAKYSLSRWRANTDEEEEVVEVPYHVSKRLKVARFVTEISRLALTVYAVDVLSVFFTTIG